MKLGFLGYGNLAMAIDAGIAKLGIIPAGDIFVCDSADTAGARARAAGHPVCGSAAELFYACDVVVILIKPKVFREIKAEFAALDTRGKRVVSCMAAVHTDELKGVFGCPVMRVRPTLASAGAADIIGHTPSREFGDLLSVLGQLGDLLCLDEKQLDCLTVAASCGLGFAARIMEVYAGECEKIGFKPGRLRRHPQHIHMPPVATCHWQAVATKGGVTEAGLNAWTRPARGAVCHLAAALEKAVPPKN